MWLPRAWFTRHFVFTPPTPPSYTRAQCRVLDDGTAVMFVDARRLAAADTLGALVVVCSHGNATDAGGGMRILETLRLVAPSLSVLSYDYPNYGHARRTADGTTTVRDCDEALRAVYRFLTEQERFDAEQVVLLGVSIGAVPTLRLAAELTRRNVRLGGIVVQSAFTSLRALVPTLLTWLVDEHDYDNTLAIARVRDDVPLLIVHGTADAVVPVSHAHTLAHVCTTAVLRVLDGVGHNDFLTTYAPLWTHVLIHEFIVQRVVAANRAAATRRCLDGACFIARTHARTHS